jgi:Domain of unknown function (DUF4286)
MTAPDAPYIYLVFVEADPKRGKPYLEWLDQKHIDAVLGDPAFLWARKIKLMRPADDGWDRYVVIYGVRSFEDFQKYRQSPLFLGLASELQKFQGTFRVNRFIGETTLSKN